MYTLLIKYLEHAFSLLDSDSTKSPEWALGEAIALAEVNNLSESFLEGLRHFKRQASFADRLFPHLSPDEDRYPHRVRWMRNTIAYVRRLQHKYETHVCTGLLLDKAKQLLSEEPADNARGLCHFLAFAYVDVHSQQCNTCTTALARLKEGIGRVVGRGQYLHLWVSKHFNIALTEEELKQVRLLWLSMLIARNKVLTNKYKAPTWVTPKL